MQGIQLTETRAPGRPNTRPSLLTLTIDLDNLDPAISPLVNALLERIGMNPPEAPDYEFAPTVEQEREEWQQAAMINLNRAYGDDEPDYSDVPAYTTSAADRRKRP